MVAVVEPLSDIVATAEKVGRAVVDLEGVPGDERARYRNVVAETFDILQQAISLPVNRLTKLLAVDDDRKFVKELAALDDLDDWAKLEHAAYLCEPLRACGREMDGMFDKLKGRLATKDWNRLRVLTQQLLEGEPGFAYLISGSLAKLSAMAPGVQASPAGSRTARKAVERTRDNLRDLRRRLLAKQLEFHKVI